MELGTAAAATGERSRGQLSVTTLPTGGAEQIPVGIINGVGSGPTVWITGAVHGDEVTGTAVVQDILSTIDPGRLAGAIVCLPIVNPAGLRTTSRQSYYHDHDPNRYFPDPEITADDRSRPPKVQELIAERLFEAFTESVPADVLLDVHTAQIGSEPFVIRDRVLYGDIREEDDATTLSSAVGEIVDAMGVPICREYAAEEYTDQGLQRSTAGAALNNAGIPAATLELGTHGIVDESMRQLGIASLCRAMIELGMLNELPEEVEGVESLSTPVGYPVKRAVHPHTEEAGIIRHRVEPGTVLESGDPVADIVSPTGVHRATVTTDHDGYVIARYEGIAAYEHDPVTSLAVRDDGDLIVPRNPD